MVLSMHHICYVCFMHLFGFLIVLDGDVLIVSDNSLSKLSHGITRHTGKGNLKKQSLTDDMSKLKKKKGSVLEDM